jgi:uncharacterized RDD family membrane protein YckC
VIDDRQTLTTPEGATLSLVPAGLLPRGAAFLIDSLIRSPIYIVAWLLMLTRSSTTTGLMLILVFLLEWFYPVLFEVFRHGQTPGKKLMGLTVTHLDGTPVTLNGSLIRNLVRQADFFPVGYLVGCVAMLCNRRFQRLGDMAASTLVIHVPAAAVTRISADIPPVAPDWTADLADQQTLVAFLERHEALSGSRRQELARLGWAELNAAEAERRALSTARFLRGAG